MNGWIQSLAVGGGAAIGANARYWLGAMFVQTFPWSTLVINVTGSLFLGVVTALSHRLGWSYGWQLFLGVGLAGGYTTFSTFSKETVELFSAGRASHAFAYALLSLVLAVAAFALGYWVATARS